MHTDDIRPPAEFDRTPADDTLDLALAVTTAGLPAVVPSVTVDQDPARAAWGDRVQKDNDLMELCIFAKQAMPTAGVTCLCGPEFECLRCRAERIICRYLHGTTPQELWRAEFAYEQSRHTPPTATEPQQGTDVLPW